MSERNADLVTQPAGVATAMAVAAATEGAQLCAMGFHAWTPWLALTAGDDGPIRCYVTLCSRCKHEEQYDL